jgi:argininosuccinate lyase
MEPKAAPLRAELVPEMLATDLAEFLVRKGVPFRETHHVSGAAVKLSEDCGVPLNALTLAQLQSLHPLFDDEAMAVLQNYEASVELKDSVGGTSKRQVLAQVDILRAYMSTMRANPPVFASAAAAAEPEA